MNNLSLQIIELQNIESQIKKICGADPSRYFVYEHSVDENHKLTMLLIERSNILNSLFKWDKEEVKRLKEINKKLFELTVTMHHRLCELYRTILKAGNFNGFDTDYLVEGVLKVGCDCDCDHNIYDTSINFINEEYYGSDFGYMLAVLANSHNRIIRDCCIIHKNTNNHNMSDDELECSYNLLDDGHSWVDTAHPHLKDTTMCYAMHQMLYHFHYSFADILRINDFNTDCTITCQHFKKD